MDYVHDSVSHVNLQHLALSSPYVGWLAQVRVWKWSNGPFTIHTCFVYYRYEAVDSRLCTWWRSEWARLQVMHSVVWPKETNRWQKSNPASAIESIQQFFFPCLISTHICFAMAYYSSQIQCRRQPMPTVSACFHDWRRGGGDIEGSGRRRSSPAPSDNTWTKRIYERPLFITSIHFVQDQSTTKVKSITDFAKCTDSHTRTDNLSRNGCLVQIYHSLQSLFTMQCIATVRVLTKHRQRKKENKGLGPSLAHPLALTFTV